MCFKSLSKWRSSIYRANVKVETVPGCVPVKEKDLSPKVFLFIVGTRSVKLLEDERSWREGVYYAAILTYTCDHFQKGSNDTEMRLCTESYMILEANEENREQEWCYVADGIEQQAWQQHSPPSGVCQWDSWVLLQARSYNSPVLRKQKQKSALWSHRRKGTGEWRQCDAVLRKQMRRHRWHAGAKKDNNQW